MYDDTKLKVAFDEWMKHRIKVGFGECYAGDLLDDFSEFLEVTGMLKSSPGRVVFGKYLVGTGKFERKKKLGLTYYIGLRLINPPERDALKPKRYARSWEVEYEAELQRQEAEMAEAFKETPEAEAARIAAFKAELETETRDKIAKVGKK